MKEKRNIKKIIISSMPRSGTVFFFEFISRLFGFTKVQPVFTGGFRPMPPEWDPYKFDQTYLQLKDGEVLGSAHYHLNREIRELLEDDELLCIYLYRDPRDVAVSSALYIKYGLEHHFLHPTFSRMSDADAISFMLSGGIIPARDLPGDIVVKDVPYVIYTGMEYFCEISYAWLLHPRLAAIRYEDFTQKQGILSEALGRVGVDVAISKIDGVSREFNFLQATEGRKPGYEDKAAHYRKGIIGDYQNYFTDLHRAICKFRIGEHLIKLGFEKDYQW